MLRSALPQELKNSLLTALLSIVLHPSASPTLAGFGLSRFVPVTYEYYAAEERALRGCENALSPNVLDAPPESKLREITGAENKATT